MKEKKKAGAGEQNKGKTQGQRETKTEGIYSIEEKTQEEGSTVKSRGEIRKFSLEFWKISFHRSALLGPLFCFALLSL